MAALVKSSYLFFGRLQFLQSTVQKNLTESNFETEFDIDENPETENSNQESSSKTPNQADKNSKQQQQRKKSNSIQPMSILQISLRKV